jgi:hypothetical protein
LYVLEVPSNYSIGTTYNVTAEHKISSIIANTTTLTNFQTTWHDPDVMPNTGISSITTQRSQTSIIESAIKPEATVETTELCTSEPERTTIQQETSMLPACICTCKIVTYIVSGFTLEENVRRLIENTLIDKEVLPLTRIGKHQRMMEECLLLLLVGWGLLVYVFPSFVSCVRTSLMGLKKAKHWGYLKQLRIVKEP